MYFLTSVQIVSKRQNQRATEFSIDCRCWGYYPTLEEAKKAVKENYGNMIECIYDYLVIEKYKPGVMQIAKDIAWYKEIDNRWIPCEKPMEVESFVNFAM